MSVLFSVLMILSIIFNYSFLCFYWLIIFMCLKILSTFLVLFRVIFICIIIMRNWSLFLCVFSERLWFRWFFIRLRWCSWRVSWPWRWLWTIWWTRSFALSFTKNVLFLFIMLILWRRSSYSFIKIYHFAYVLMSMFSSFVKNSVFGYRDSFSTKIVSILIFIVLICFLILFINHALLFDCT